MQRVARRATLSGVERLASRYAEIEPDLRAFCRWLTGAEDLACELFQDTWHRILERPGAYREELSFKAWTFSIARHLWIDRVRRKETERRAVRARAGGLREAVVPADPLPLKEALSRLAEPEREAVVLYHLQGLSLREAARVLEVTPWVVRERLARAQESLERLLRID